MAPTSSVNEPITHWFGSTAAARGACRTCPVPFGKRRRHVLRCDFPRWRQRLGECKQRIAQRMALGERTTDLSRQFAVSEGRVSQWRREFELDWRQFHGESDALKQEVLAAA